MPGCLSPYVPCCSSRPPWPGRWPGCSARSCTRLEPAGLPLGLLVAGALSAAVFVTCGLALGRPGAVAAAGGWLLVVLLLASQRPEGDLVVPGSTEGYVWLLGGMLVAGACILPHYRTPARRPPDPPSADAEDGR